MKLKEINWIQLKELRKELIQKQENMCPICGRLLVKPVLDHHHTKRIGGSGRIRQVICATCNVFLGKIENNCKRFCIQNDILPFVLRNIADYLERKQTEYLHPSERVFEKLKKSDYNKIKKYYFEMFPKRKKMIEYPKSGKMNKKFKEILNKIEEIENDEKQKRDERS